MAMTELDDLKALLKKDVSGGKWYREGWSELRSPGDELEGFTVLETVEGENRRWAQAIQVIVESTASTRTYSFTYDRGLTEMQEDEFWSDTVKEVFKISRLQLVTSWED